MTSVGKRQNEPDALRLLAAQRCLYSRAKLYGHGEGIVTILLAAVSPIVIWLLPAASQWLAALAGLWLLIARLVFQPWTRELVEQAAVVQEAFDSHVFDLGWNDAIEGQPAREDVATWADRCRPRDEPLADWYAATDGTLAQQAVASQRMSVVWSRRLHRRYGRLVAVAAVAWFLIMLGFAVWFELRLAEALVAILLPSLPALVAGVDQASSHQRASDRAKLVERAIDRALNSDVDQNVARALQDEIYHFRLEAPLVPDWFYRRHREGDQEAMRYGADGFRSAE